MPALTGLQKTQWTNTSRWHGSPTHHWLWKLHTGLQATWILCLSTLPPDSGTLFPNEMQNYFHLKRGLWTTEQQSSLFFSTAQVRCFWRCLWFRSGLVALFLKTSESGWLLMHWLQLQSTPCEALPSVWISFAWLYSQACGHLCCLCTFFLPKFFLPVNFAFNMLWYSTL